MRSGLWNDPGLENCVINSIVQGLYTLKDLRDEIIDFPYGEEHIRHGKNLQVCTLCSLKDLFVAMRKNEPNAVIMADKLRLSLQGTYKELFKDGAGIVPSTVLQPFLDALHRSSGVSDGSTNCTCPVDRLMSVNISIEKKCKAVMNDDLKKPLCDGHFSSEENLYFLEVYPSDFQSLNDTPIFAYPPVGTTCTWCDSQMKVKIGVTTSKFVLVRFAWEKPFKEEQYTAALDGLHSICLQTNPQCCIASQHMLSYAISDQGPWYEYDDQNVKMVGTLKEVLATCKVKKYLPGYLFYKSNDPIGSTTKKKLYNTMSVVRLAEKHEGQSSSWCGSFKFRDADDDKKLETDIVVDNRASRRNHIMDLCIECQANQASATSEECTVAWGIECQANQASATSEECAVAWGVCNHTFRSIVLDGSKLVKFDP